MPEKTDLFDHASEAYDATFTNSNIGKMQRGRVYHWLTEVRFFERIQSVFEINCGTGADADYFANKGLKVTATDQSANMIAVAKESRNAAITFFQLDFTDLNQNMIISDALFSNFGGLNCIPENELEQVARTIEGNQRRGDLLIWVLMPRFCMMESLYMLSRFKFKQLFRRNTSKGVAVNVDGTDVTTFYHSPKRVRKLLSAGYTIKQTKPVAFFLPPSYLENFFKRHLRFLRLLNRMEKFAGRFSFLSAWSDHYIIIGEKK